MSRIALAVYLPAWAFLCTTLGVGPEKLSALTPGSYNLGVIDLLARAVAKVVVPLFFAGMAGSVVVIVISFVEDMRELLVDEE